MGCIAYRVAKSQTPLSDFHSLTHSLTHLIILQGWCYCLHYHNMLGWGGVLEGLLSNHQEIFKHQLSS